jgi:hypothetical protein
MAFMEHAVAHLVVRLPQGPPHQVEVHCLGLRTAMLHKPLEGVHEHLRIAHGGQGPGRIT